jgi:DNA-binding response OmpR family regulator
MARILIVDDEPLISMLVENWLGELGHEVAGPVRSVAEGLAFVEQDPAIDGAILDVNLGKESSYPLATVLRERGVPVAFATGDGNIDAVEEFAGSLVLEKPFDFESVKTTMATLLGQGTDAKNDL